MFALFSVILINCSPETGSRKPAGEPLVLVRTFSPRYLTASRGRFAKLPPISGIHASLQRLQRRRLAERAVSKAVTTDRTAQSLRLGFWLYPLFNSGETRLESRSKVSET